MIPQIEAKRQGLLPLSNYLFRRIQHILYKNPVPPCRVIHKDMSHRPHQLAILNNGTAAHE